MPTGTIPRSNTPTASVPSIHPKGPRFLVAPCRPRTPEHKGKVESGVHFVKRNFLGGRTPTTLSQANQDVLTWCQTTAGQRTHGTTKHVPLVQFRTTEQPAPQALPASRVPTCG